MEDIILERFKARIADMGLHIERIDEEELIYIKDGDGELTISLDNVRKSYEQEGTFDHLDGLIDSIHNYLVKPLIPTWDEAYLNVYQSLFPANYEWGDFIHQKVTDDFYINYVYCEDGQYVWIRKDQLNDWNINEDTFKKQVAFNMNTLLDESEVELTETDEGLPLAYFNCRIEGLKAPLLFSSDLRKKLEPFIGWPIYCVLPVRDFCYAFSEKHEELIEQLGGLVIEEFNNSAYPITTEILKITDDGIAAIGKYESSGSEGTK